MNYLKERDGDLFSNADLKQLIVPLLIEQLLAIAVGMADSIMVSSVGEAAVSSVSLIDTIFILLINMFTAIATGGAVVCGQYIGKKRPHKACEAADQLLLVTTALSVVIMAAVYLLKPFILHVVFGNITAEVERNCNIYLMIVAASIPFLAVYNGCAAIFRAQGFENADENIHRHEPDQYFGKCASGLCAEIRRGRRCDSDAAFTYVRGCGSICSRT